MKAVDALAIPGVGGAAQEFEFEIGVQRIVAQFIGQAREGGEVPDLPGQARRLILQPLVIQLCVACSAAGAGRQQPAQQGDAAGGGHAGRVREIMAEGGWSWSQPSAFSG